MAGKGTLKKLKFAGAGLVIGLVLGIAGTFFFQNYNPPDEEQPLSTSIVFERIVAQDELVCASQKYNITDKVTDANTFFDLFDIPFTENSFWYRYVGTIKVGVDLETAEFSSEGTVIKAVLDQPYIISNTPNMEESGCLEENNNILNPIHVEDVEAFQQRCIEQSEANLIQGGIFDEARQNAASNLNDMFNAALGDGYTVEVEWRSGASNEA